MVFFEHVPACMCVQNMCGSFGEKKSTCFAETKGGESYWRRQRRMNLFSFLKKESNGQIVYCRICCLQLFSALVTRLFYLLTYYTLCTMPFLWYLYNLSCGTHIPLHYDCSQYFLLFSVSFIMEKARETLELQFMWDRQPRPPHSG